MLWFSWITSFKKSKYVRLPRFSEYFKVHRCGPGGSMRACHAVGPGSIPGRDRFPGWGFRDFSSPVRQMSGSFRPRRSPNIIWPSLSSTSFIIHYGRQWPEMLTRPKTLNIHTCIHTYMHTYMHTCIHAYMHTCIHTYMHTCIHAYMRTCVHAYMRTCVNACVRACMRACVHACVRACVHACVHACIHACMRTCVHAYMRT